MISAEIKVDYVNHCGDDLSTVNAARVSMDKVSEPEYFNCRDDHDLHEKMLAEGWEDNTDYANGWHNTCQRLKESDTKLINYLARHKHRSPFNHSFISVRVQCPVFVARQLVKHKFMPLNEVSRRYVDSEPEFYMPKGLRAKAENVKQGSSADIVNDLMYIHNDGEGDCHGMPEDAVAYTVNEALRIYQGLLDKGVCAEQARMVLPQNMMTTFIWSGTLGAFADMLVLRLSPYTQAETRIVAEQIRDIVQPLFPVSMKALLENA